jgi:hypothetical protein
MKIVNLKSKDEEESKKNIEHMLSIIDDFRKKVEEGQIQEFIVSYMDSDGNVEISANCKDFVGAVGIAETAKQIILHQYMAE